MYSESIQTTMLLLYGCMALYGCDLSALLLNDGLTDWLLDSL